MARLTEEDRIVIKVIHQEKGYGARKILKEFPNKCWSLASVNRLLLKIKQTGSHVYKKRTGRKISVRTQSNIEQVNRLIAGQPKASLSIRKLAQQTGIKRSSIYRIVKKDLQLKTNRSKCVWRQAPQPPHTKRLEAAEALLRRFGTEDTVTNIWFTDERVFTLDKPQSSSGQSSAEQVINGLETRLSHFNASVTVCVAASCLGKTSVVFLDNGVKLNARNYCDDVLSRLIPQMRVFGNAYVLQLDAASAHRAKYTLRYVQDNCPEVIEPSAWPPNSPDLNPIEYFVWGVLTEKVYDNQGLGDVGQLKECIVDAWNSVCQESITSAIHQWRKRLQTVVREKGGHIDKFF